KTPLIQRAGVVSFLVQREVFPYRYVAVEASVVQTDQPPAAEQMLAILHRYLPAEQAQAFVDAELTHPTGTLRLFTVRRQRWLSADFGCPTPARSEDGEEFPPWEARSPRTCGSKTRPKSPPGSPSPFSRTPRWGASAPPARPDRDLPVR